MQIKKWYNTQKYNNEQLDAQTKKWCNNPKYTIKLKQSKNFLNL